MQLIGVISIKALNDSICQYLPCNMHQERIKKALYEAEAKRRDVVWQEQ